MPEIAGYASDEVGYHAYLLVNSGLAEGYSVRNTGHRNQFYFINNLTMPGHEFAALVRDEAIWSRALDEAQHRGPVTFNSLRTLLSSPRSQDLRGPEATALPPNGFLYVVTTKTLSFVIRGENGTIRQALPPIRPGGTHRLPDWVRDDPTFKVALADGTLTIVPAPAPSRGKSGGDETFLEAARPKFMYHPTKRSIQVFSRREIDALGPEWSETYLHQEYPKVKYHWNGKDKTVKSAEEESALGPGWANTLAAFAPYVGPRPPRTSDKDVTKWLAAWSVAGLTEDLRKRIRAQLLRADALFLRAPEQGGVLEAMRQAFSGIAGVLHSARILTEEILQNDLPNFVWDSAIAAGWWRRASESRQDIFSEAVGHYWIWRADDPAALELFHAETGEWIATLLENPRARIDNDGFLDFPKRAPGMSDSWSDLCGEFERYVTEYDELAGDVDSLRPGQWALSQASSPRAERVFKEIATKAAARAKLKAPDDQTEPWQLWLEFLWDRRWRRPETRLGQRDGVREVRSWTVARRMAEEGARTLPRVFQTSADCCRDLNETGPAADRLVEQAQPEIDVPTLVDAITLSPSENGMVDKKDQTETAPAAAALLWPDPDLDLASEEGRNRAIAAYCQSWHNCSEASLARTATVDTADLSKWKKGTLPALSEKKARIEKALHKNEPPKSLPERPKD